MQRLWQDSVAIVTGAASGIGRALSAGLVGRGACVVLADVDEAAVVAVAADLGRRGPGEARAIGLDVTDGPSVRAAYQDVAAEHGRLDLVCNNAGIAVAGPVESLGLAHWDAAIDVNLRGVVHGVHAAYPIMRRAGSGQILNTASLAGLATPPLMAPYVATKWAVVGLSLSLRAEAARHGVRVSALCPGFTDTPMLGNVNPGLPQVAPGGGRPRRYATGRPYDPDQLARETLSGLERDRPLIVAPASARLVWRFGRFAPTTVTVAVAGLAGRRAGARRRRMS